MVTPSENPYSRIASSQDIGFLLEDKIQDLGGKFECADVMEPYVVVDGRLYTGQNPYSAKLLADRIAQDLKH